MTLLSDVGITAAMKTGRVLVHPFRASHLNTSSYDVSLGPFYYRESVPQPGKGVYNPFSEEMVHRVWGKPQEAVRAGDWMQENGTVLDNIAPTDSIIWIAPGETILGHTQEFIGGRESVTTMMKARSSLGRYVIP